jgi:hypothetical protein
MAPRCLFDGVGSLGSLVDACFNDDSQQERQQQVPADVKTPDMPYAAKPNTSLVGKSQYQQKRSCAQSMIENDA